MNYLCDYCDNSSKARVINYYDLHLAAILGEFVHVNPYTGPPTWGELTEKAAQTMFYTVS